MKRIFDCVVACLLLFVLSPILWIVIVVLGGWKQAFHREMRLGLQARAFEAIVFNTQALHDTSFIRRWGISNWPLLWNIVKGDLSFVGPRALAPVECDSSNPVVHKRFTVKPGLVCLWTLRHRANIAYENEWEMDAEYVERQSFWVDLGILFRGLVTWPFGIVKKDCCEKVEILGISIDNCTMDETIDRIEGWLKEGGQQRICFVNAHGLNVAQRNGDYRDCVNGANLVLADGIGLQLAGRFLGRPLVQNVNGTDLFPRLCHALQHSGRRIYLFGGHPGAAEAVREWMMREFAELSVVGCHHGYLDSARESEAIEAIKNSQADLLLVALGVPKQELWIEKHLEETGVKVAIGVGGLFDFYSGRAPRAPLWMRESGLEWMYRLLREPGRLWKRYVLGNVLFIFWVVQERLKSQSRGAS